MTLGLVGAHPGTVPNQLRTAQEVADALASPGIVRAATVEQARLNGELVGTRIGRRWLYAPEDVSAWLRASREVAAPAPFTRRTTARRRAHAS